MDEHEFILFDLRRVHVDDAWPYVYLAERFFSHPILGSVFAEHAHGVVVSELLIFCWLKFGIALVKSICTVRKLGNYFFFLFHAVHLLSVSWQ